MFTDTCFPIGGTEFAALASLFSVRPLGM